MKKILVIGIIALLALGTGLTAASVSYNRPDMIRPHDYRSVKLNIPTAVPVYSGISFTRMIEQDSQRDSPFSVEDSVSDKLIILRDSKRFRDTRNFSGNKPPAIVPVSGISITEKELIDELNNHPDSPYSVKNSGCDSKVIPQDNADTEQITISPDMIKAIGSKVDEVAPLRATYYISGTRDPNNCHLYRPWYFEQGETARIRLTWSPGSSTLFVGMCDLSGHCWGGEFTGGSCDVTLVCQESGQYYVGISNKSPETIRYSGYITV